MKFDNIPHGFRVENHDTGEVFCTFAVSDEKALKDISQYSEGLLSVEEMFTSEGYRIMRLRDIPKGSYFSFVQGDDPGKTCKQVWVKDDYDRSTRKYNIHRFDDVNHEVQRNSSSLVTIDITF